jgi:hypothetical protein
MMLGEEHATAEYWRKCGDEALAKGIEHVIMMVRNPPDPSCISLHGPASQHIAFV